MSFALRVVNSPTSRKLLSKLAGWAALHQQEIHGTAALIREVGSVLRLASERRQQRLYLRHVLEADAQVKVVVYPGLLAYQRIDAPATVDPIVDPTGVKGSQDLDYVLTRHLSHDARTADPLWLRRATLTNIHNRERRSKFVAAHGDLRLRVIGDGRTP